MKYVDEYRDGDLARRYVDAIRAEVTRPWVLMEVCGGQTHAIVRFGIDQLLPRELELLHGPGCPVCVTPIDVIDAAIDAARRPDVTLCSFGDMLRVPGSSSDLLREKAAGADVRVVTSPMDALALAKARPDRHVVFFGVGFETTAPANAMAVHEAKRAGVPNFSMIVAHVLVPPALDAILSDAEGRVNGLLAAGHVCAVMGTADYAPIAARYQVPIVVTGFEPADILQGVLMCVRQLEAGRSEVENQYARAVRDGGNPHAVAMIREVFDVVPRAWRGIGDIAASGLALRERYRDFDAVRRLDLSRATAPAVTPCIAGLVLMGKKRPADCPAFGVACTPDTPLGAPMVSTEGACAAYFRYRRAAP